MTDELIREVFLGWDAEIGRCGGVSGGGQGVDDDGGGGGGGGFPRLASDAR